MFLSFSLVALWVSGVSGNSRGDQGHQAEWSFPSELAGQFGVSTPLLTSGVSPGSHALLGRADWSGAAACSLSQRRN